MECDYVITTTPVEPALAVVAAELRTAGGDAAANRHLISNFPEPLPTTQTKHGITALLCDAAA